MSDYVKKVARGNPIERARDAAWFARQGPGDRKVVARTRIHNRARAGEGVSMEYLRNTWYAVAWSDEIGDQPFGRKVIEDPLVIYRTAAGELHVLRDMCPPRFAPLSKGKIISEIGRESTRLNSSH